MLFSDTKWRLISLFLVLSVYSCASVLFEENKAAKSMSLPIHNWSSKYMQNLLMSTYNSLLIPSYIFVLWNTVLDVPNTNPKCRDHRRSKARKHMRYIFNGSREICTPFTLCCGWLWLSRNNVWPSELLNSLRPRPNRRHFADDIFKRIF